MTTTFSGTTGITYPDGSTQSSAQVGMKNRVIDGGFTINQRVYVSGTALSAGVYAHDRWKAGASGCTYTFTQGSLGVNTTITITAGSLQQVIEGCNMGEGGTYTLSWSGTAQGRVNGGSYAASPVVVTGLTAGANCTIEFNTGTVGSVQLEKGSTATSFDYRPYGTELDLCLRYYEQYNFGTTTSMMGSCISTNTAEFVFIYQKWKRASPTVTINNTSYYRVNDWKGGDQQANGFAAAETTTRQARLQFTKATANLNVGYGCYMNREGSVGLDPYIYINSEL